MYSLLRIKTWSKIVCSSLMLSGFVIYSISIVMCTVLTQVTQNDPILVIRNALILKHSNKNLPNLSFLHS